MNGALTEGTILADRYQILALAGAGNSGLLYKALDRHLQRPAAVKELFPSGMAERTEENRVLFPGLAGEQVHILLDAFRREAENMAVLGETDGIPFLLDAFEENGTAYIVMVYVEGITLAEELRLRGGKLSPGEAAVFLLPLAEILDRMHARGLVHRDISPANVLIRTDGRPCLLDLGSAEDAFTACLSSRTVNEGFSPYEQYLQEGKTGSRTDIYALGALLYLCLLGEPPPPAPRRREGIPLFDRKRRGTGVFKTVIERAMAEEPSSRYPSAAAFGEALREALRRRRRRSLGLCLCAAAAACASLLFLIGSAGTVKPRETAFAQPAPIVAEGEPIPGMSGCYEIRSCLEGSLLWAVSQESETGRRPLILWTQVWDDTQRFFLDEQQEAGIYRISCRQDGRMLWLTQGTDDGELYFAEGENKGNQLFRLVAGGEDTCLLQGMTLEVAGIRLFHEESGTEQGQLITAAPYDSFEDSRAVRWLLHRAEESP